MARTDPAVYGKSYPVPLSGVPPRPMEPAEQAVRIPAGKVSLEADLVPPRSGKGAVIFAHGSGSGRRSPRNRLVATRLRATGLGTLLLDLLSEHEARVDELTAEHRFDIPLLTDRLLVATDWLRARPEVQGTRLGYFGASTGGAVAMIAATQRAEAVGAIVLRGARSDLGDSAVGRIRCPTLILVGGNDDFIQEVNARTIQRLTCKKELVTIPGASHLFEEPGTLELVAERTADWFDHHLSRPGR